MTIRSYQTGKGESYICSMTLHLVKVKKHPLDLSNSCVNVHCIIQIQHERKKLWHGQGILVSVHFDLDLRDMTLGHLLRLNLNLLGQSVLELSIKQDMGDQNDV